jgi:large subunit ribosomal protein L24
MRGDRKGSEGKVSRIDHRKYRIFIEGITREKIDGTAIPVPIHPSKVMITNLNLDDKWRSEALKVKAPKEAEKPVEEKKKPKRERKKRRPRKAAKEKTEASRRRRNAKPTEEGKKEETEVG